MTYYKEKIMKNPKNRVKNLIVLAFIVIICSFHLQAQTASQLEDFQTWLKKLNRMASIRGISQATSEDVFNNIKLLPKIGNGFTIKIIL